MSNFLYLTSLFVLLFTTHISAQTTNSLRQEIQYIISTKNAVIGVAVISDNKKDTLSFGGEQRFPLQSVFKFHIALAVLSEIDKGKFSLDQKIEIKKQELLPELYSPIRDEFPNGTTLSIAEILKYTVSQSDNVGCDILLKLIGGPQMIEKYFKSNHFEDISIKINEETQQANWDLQFKNWTTPKAANEVLQSFYNNKNKLLSKKSHTFIWEVMKATETGKKRLKGQLPENTIVAHKTGTSGTNKEGLTSAVNDIGVVFLPNGHHYFISVFVTNSTENADTNEKIIADISKATWDYFTLTKK